MPWTALRSPLEQWAVMPSFLLGELLFIGLATAALVHALRTERAHLLAWLGALVAGTANDLIFMALPLVDNFWHAQATVMLTPRLPLYIPCLYVCFLYYPTVAVRRVGARGLAAGALTGLCAALFYAPFDIVGAKLLWWTWHDTDLPIAERILGAPASSTLWVLTFAGSFAWLLDRALARDPKVSARTFGLGLLMLAGLTTVVMVLQITPLQQLDGGAPGYVALATGIVAYAALAWRGRARLSIPEPRPTDRVAWFAVLVHAAVLLTIALSFDPATHRSTGVHQTVGECYVEAQDVTGLTRHLYLCADDYDEGFSFDCAATPVDGARWYTVCGRPHDAFGAWATGVGALTLAIALVFSLLFGRLSPPRAR